MHCSPNNVFCDTGAVAPLGEPLVVNNDGDYVLLGLASWSGSCTDGPQVKGKPIGIYHQVVSSLDWILGTVYRNGGPGTGICCRGEGGKLSFYCSHINYLLNHAFEILLLI